MLLYHVPKTFTINLIVVRLYFKLQVKAKVESNVGSVQCDVCKILVKYAQQYIEKNTTEVRQCSSMVCLSGHWDGFS